MEENESGRSESEKIESNQEPRGFWGLFATQVQGAFSDSVIKFLLVFLVTASITDKVLESNSLGSYSSVRELPEEIQDEVMEEVRDRRNPFITLILILFASPMILFAQTAGFLADRFSKSRIVFCTKVAEIAIMSLATVALYFQSISGLLVVLFLMSMQSTFFSPPRLGMMPELLNPSRLSWGNGIMGMGSFFSMIIGGLIAGLLSDSLGIEKAWQAGLLLVLLAVVGTLCSMSIAKLPSANPSRKYKANFLAEIATNLKHVRHDRILSLAIAGSFYFWFLAALFGEPTVLVYGLDLLDLKDAEIGMLRAGLALGIAFGCLLAGILSSGKIEYGLIPLGSIGLTVAAALLAIPNLVFWQVFSLLFLIGVSGGFFVVPINSIVQFRPKPENRGNIIATERWLTAVSVLMAAGMFYLLSDLLKMEPTQIFLAGSVVTLLVTLYTFWLLPDAFVRLVLWLLTHTLYRVRIVGRENIPDQGGALLVANHLSMADALFVIASTDRKIRFIMHQTMYRRWWIYPFARMLKAIPIASDMGPREMLKSLNKAHECVENGEVVCIFAEGQIGRFGQTLPFRKGLNRILKGSSAPIIPLHLDNVWGSIFSFERGKFYFKIPRKIPYPITVSYGQAMEPNSPPHLVRKAVVDLGVEAWKQRKSRMPTVPDAIIQAARRYRFRIALSDNVTAPIRFSTALKRAILLSKRLESTWDQQQRIGILLPPSVDSVLLNWAVLLSGRVPVNLDYRLAAEELANTIDRCRITTVFASRNLDFGLQSNENLRIEYLEDYLAKPSFLESTKCWFFASLCPKKILKKILTSTSSQPSIDDAATISFSRGLTGERKLVMLSHYNLVSNIQQLNQVFSFTRGDSFLSVIPFCHSLGFSTSIVLPPLLGISAHFHPDASDGYSIGTLAESRKTTVFMTTPQILESCLRSTSSSQFGSLETVLSGGAKLEEDLFVQFEDKFGIKIFEGYGCAECSPIVSVNTFDFRAAGKRQVGFKRGSTGIGLPGLTTKIVDPESGDEKEFGQTGTLLVSGPNVMLGYFDEKGAVESGTENGWFDTGDTASVDEDGFLTIESRQSSP